MFMNSIGCYMCLFFNGKEDFLCHSCIVGLESNMKRNSPEVNLGESEGKRK